MEPLEVIVSEQIMSFVVGFEFVSRERGFYGWVVRLGRI